MKLQLVLFVSLCYWAMYAPKASAKSVARRMIPQEPYPVAHRLEDDTYVIVCRFTIEPPLLSSSSKFIDVGTNNKVCHNVCSKQCPLDVSICGDPINK